ncbi:MAG TPA: hypothetical protein VGP19_01840 [Candidatus Acidoferrales bacterium]|jgi:hypothetical protein|nr:hypothetical protein [Candidatus Acidoferrales bacterium]
MRVKTALWAVPLAFFVAVAWSGTCFSQSDFGTAPSGEQLRSTANNPNQPFIAAFSAISLNQMDSQANPAAAEAGGAASPEEAEPAPKRPGQVSSSKVGIGVKFSTLGVGVEAATPLAGKLNVRAGFNFFRYSRGITSDGILYDGHLHLQSGEAHLDWFPFGGFHVSPGLLFYNGNSVVASAAVPAGKTISLGGTQYESDPAAPVTGNGTLDFVKVAPSIMVGVGNLIPRNGRHYSFLFEIGGAYQGSARVALNFSGNVCDTTGTICRPISSDPTVQSNIQAQEQKIQNDVNPYRFFPVVSFGVGFNF